MKTSIKQYYIAYERDAGGYLASAPAIPGCVVYGKTLNEAYRNIRSAIQECVEVRKEFKQSPPRETIPPNAIRRFSFVTLKEYVKA